MKNPTDCVKIAHLINLVEVGGLQRIYLHFAALKSDSLRTENHILCNFAKADHQLLQKIKALSPSIHDISRFRKPKILKKSRFLRKIYRRLIWKNIAYPIVMLWSDPQGLEVLKIVRNAMTIYYEHGASWFRENDAQWKLFLSKVDCIICNSFAAKRLIEVRFGFANDERIEVCANPLLPDCVPPSIEPRSYPLHRAFRLGCAGRLVDVKGIPLAIHAVRELKKRDIRCELRVAGTGRDLTALEQLCEELGVQSEVKFLGFVRDMQAFYADIDCLLCPSMREPFGLVCVEAMAHGCPVIATRVDGIPEIVRHLETGFCIAPTVPVEHYPEFGGKMNKIPRYVYNPDADCLERPRLLDPGVLADNIQSLLADQALYQRMSAAAIRIALKEFDFALYAERLLSILIRVANRKRQVNEA